MNLVLIVVELCSLRTFKYIFQSTLLLILPMALFSSGFPDVVDTISITVVIIVICSSVNTYFSYVEVSLYTWFVEGEGVHSPSNLNFHIWYEFEIWTSNSSRQKETIVLVITLLTWLVCNLKITNHFLTKLRDQDDNATNQLYLSR